MIIDFENKNLKEITSIVDAAWKEVNKICASTDADALEKVREALAAIKEREGEAWAEAKNKEHVIELEEAKPPEERSAGLIIVCARMRAGMMKTTELLNIMRWRLEDREGELVVLRADD